MSSRAEELPPQEFLKQDWQLKEGGRIAAIARNGRLPQADQVMDAKGNVILPEIIDAHVHTEVWPSLKKTSTWAAAVGGITTILEMPYSDPPTTSAEAFDAKRKEPNRKFLLTSDSMAVPERIVSTRSAL